MAKMSEEAEYLYLAVGTIAESGTD
jgi:hypothetical protein